MGQGKAIAGFVLGIVGVVIAAISFMACGLCIPIAAALSIPDPGDVAVFF